MAWKCHYTQAYGWHTNLVTTVLLCFPCEWNTVFRHNTRQRSPCCSHAAQCKVKNALPSISTNERSWKDVVSKEDSLWVAHQRISLLWACNTLKHKTQRKRWQDISLPNLLQKSPMTFYFVALLTRAFLPMWCSCWWNLCLQCARHGMKSAAQIMVVLENYLESRA